MLQRVMSQTPLLIFLVNVFVEGSEALYKCKAIVDQNKAKRCFGPLARAQSHQRQE